MELFKLTAQRGKGSLISSIITQRQKVEGLLSGDLELVDFVDHFFQKFNVAGILERAGLVRKRERGIGPPEILKYEIRLVFHGISAHMNARERLIPPIPAHSVDRFRNNPDIDWLRFTTILAERVFSEIDGTDEELRGFGGVLCVDDTDFKRPSSKKAEYISTKRSHLDMRYFKGYKLLSCCYFRGGVALPTGGALVSSSDPGKFLAGPLRSPKGDGEVQRERRARSTLYDVMVEEISMAAFYGFKVAYVAFDSWFAEPSPIRRVYDLGFHVVGMLKGKGRTKYKYKGKWLSVEQIHGVLGLENPLAAEEAEEGGVLFSADVLARDSSGVVFPLRLVFLKNFAKSRGYACLASTDVSLSAEAIRKIYSVRWKIEVIFWFLKSQNIRLNMNRRNLKLSAMDEHVAVCFTVYILLVAEMGLSGSHSVWEQFQECRRETLDIAWLRAAVSAARSVLDLDAPDAGDAQKIREAAESLLGNAEFADRVSSLPAWAFRKKGKNL